MSLTDDEIRALLELEAKATPGPLKVVDLRHQQRGKLHLDHPVGTLARCDRVEDAELQAAARNALRPLCEEVLRLRAEVREQDAELLAERAVCACGCPESQHENVGGPEDGEQCEHEEHQCIRVARGIAAMFAALRADLARHRAVERFACFELRRDRGDVIWNGVLKCLNDAAEGRWSDVPPEALAGAEPVE